MKAKTQTFVVANHISGGRSVLAVCDSAIHSKKFEEGGIVLDLGSRFYHGEEKDAKEAADMMGKAYIINAAGKDAVALAIKLGHAAKENVKSVSGVPHVQVLMM